MRTPAFSLDGVHDALRAAPLKSRGGGRAVMFVSALRGAGVSTIVRAAARAWSDHTVYCVDLDLRRNALPRAFAAEGPPFGPKIDGKLGGTSFYRILEANGATVHELAPAFTYHRLGRTRAYVGAFEPRAVPEGGRVLISSDPDYWDAARGGGALAVVDAPALERSALGLRVAAHMDGVVLVVSDTAEAAPAALAAKAEIQAAGANLLGLVYARASAPIMTLDRLFG